LEIGRMESWKDGNLTESDEGGPVRVDGRMGGWKCGRFEKENFED